MLMNTSKTAFYHSVYHPRAFTSLQMCFCLIINHYILSQLYTVCFFKSNFQCMKINSLPLSKIICIVSIVIHIIFKPKIVSTIITLYIDLGIKKHAVRYCAYTFEFQFQCTYTNQKLSSICYYVNPELDIVKKGNSSP